MCQARGAWSDRRPQVRLKRGSGQGLTLSVPGAIRRCRKGLEGLAGSGLQLLGVRLIAVWRKA